MFEKYRKFETTFAGRPLVVETGKTCELVQRFLLGSLRRNRCYGKCNRQCKAERRRGLSSRCLWTMKNGCMPLAEFPARSPRERESPSEKAILTSRMVDRPIRPLFPKDMRNDVSVVMTVLAVDPDCSPEIAGMLATSIAISISDIPWNGPIAGISVGLVDGEIVLNPTARTA